MNSINAYIPKKLKLGLHYIVLQGTLKGLSQRKEQLRQLGNLRPLKCPLSEHLYDNDRDTQYIKADIESVKLAGNLDHRPSIIHVRGDEATRNILPTTIT